MSQMYEDDVLGLLQLFGPLTRRQVLPRYELIFGVSTRIRDVDDVLASLKASGRVSETNGCFAIVDRQQPPDRDQCGLKRLLMHVLLTANMAAGALENQDAARATLRSLQRTYSAPIGTGSSLDTNGRLLDYSGRLDPVSIAARWRALKKQHSHLIAAFLQGLLSDLEAELAAFASHRAARIFGDPFPGSSPVRVN